MNRREFLKMVGGGIVGSGLGLTQAGPGWGAVPPSERVVMGIIGVGGMGKGHLNWFSGFDDVEIVALCDVDGNRLNEAASLLKKKRPWAKAALYNDFRALLDRGDIDAVSIATPDHWHAHIAVRAFMAGKDVYGEKPLSYSLSEGRAMRDACRKHRRVFQLGTQIHAGENYHRVVELVRSGRLGDVHTVLVWKTGGTPMIKRMPDRAPPSALDWEMWLGPRPARPYNPNRSHYLFRYYWDYSGGQFADFWCHIFDIVYWALDPGAPGSVQARGVLNSKGMAETHEWIDVDYTFDGLKVFWTTGTPDVPGADKRGIGACFMGTRGHLVTDYGSRRIFLDGEEVEGGDLPDVPRSIARSPGHQRNFIDCVKSRGVTESPLDYAYDMTVPMHLGLAAFWTGRTLAWDGEAERFIDDEEANRLLCKSCREDWAISGI